MIQPISQHSTPRKCSVCLKPATLWVTTAKDTYEADDKSSVQPRCSDHQETA